MCNKLKFEILPDYQIEIFDKIIHLEWIKDFYLAGGTGLALQIGHRESIDFDFFSSISFDTLSLLNKLQMLGNVKVISQSNNILHCFLNNIQISFFKVQYDLIDKPIEYHNLKIASTLDIILMKLQAISGTGSRKDFIDLYFLLKQYNLNDINNLYKKKYGIMLQSDYHLHKALVYFNDAENQPFPKMFIEIHWEQIKNAIIEIVRKFSYEKGFIPE
ncbi:MAG TPA: nucleotidyl transferase AbiEii/AbiGii toxin family protein [Candidatus Kapabacteria bacterium]|nr:nucleotidyl transferase AbiEii/AbiGii toxin family protein [Candidatus Kapabacteria bacterium]HPO62991.1 nucleotidyl transferase AbiEii/AbiGii toxin family protein [Candidatus Kapabacteria bacterium]